MRSDEKTMRPIVAAMKSMTGAEAAEYLMAHGLIDRRAAEREYVRERMQRLTVGEGMPRCRAMEEIADEICCSYEKVRGIIYSR